MSDPQVLLDPRGASPHELRAAVETLVRQVAAVDLVDPTDDQLADLRRGHGDAVRVAERVDPGRPVLVTSGRVCWAAGAVRRVLADLATPGRLLTRVLVPEAGRDDTLVGCWSADWVAAHPVTLAELVGASLPFDREHLPRDSSLARSWLRAEAVGVTVASEVGDDPRSWARRRGAELAAEEAVAAVRGPLGSLRRTLRRREQRRTHAQRTS